ncbi:hypothetical protein SPRG_07548 [Saprolegnia parasitica CBS 223.65]|uniref:JmjC domain-containing protein n=1 Tax=Saprolegnia parasitica (strain CBS 223.65) TaxID=695850 RepID=A0A067C9Y8_SAPPC|nr:hypothetical protein SPRG_07548 [Saprolegnia parasitica CBS 223.65]KDO27298.1 hypothetical protein SPRG_07548 [Saprolegnia parasitica CBS 223.65]|eukprot:XP_012202072.1 hypothetical protein SPRG_07548 [Saprolegnia parasitica CBS 223.65]
MAWHDHAAQGDDDATTALLASAGFVAHHETVVDVACAPVAEDAYSGDVCLRQSVELKFGDFVAYYEAKRRGQSHWLMDTEDELQFYLAQCPLQSTTPATPAVLPHLASTFPPPKAIAEMALTQVNLWMTLQASRTTLHYDAYDNVLTVVRGAKHVKLFAPTSDVGAHPVTSKSANHARLTLDELDARAPDATFTVTPTDALFIPEGWWHQVSSDPFTIAVNYWFDGLRPALVQHPHMQPYYARVLLEDMLAHARKQALQAYLDRQQVTLGTSLPFPDAAAMAMAAHVATHATTTPALLSLVPRRDIHCVCLALSASFPVAWKQLLQKDAPTEVLELLTEAWDDHEAIVHTTRVASPGAYFEAIYAPFSLDEQEELQAHLLAAKEAFALHVCHDLLRSTLGLSS